MVMPFGYVSGADGSGADWIAVGGTTCPGMVQSGFPSILCTSCCTEASA